MVQIDTNDLALGDEAEDEITGFRGVLIGFTQWITGCARAQLQPKVDKEGKVPESQGFDVTTLKLVKAGPNHVKPRAAAATGGPRPNPSRRRDVSR